MADSDERLQQRAQRLGHVLAAQVMRDAYARLLDAGAAMEARIDLASVFVDVPFHASDDEPDGQQSVPALGSLLANAGHPRPGADGVGWMLVGGPGSGKTTITTLLAQATRAAWLADNHVILAPQLRADLEPVLANLRKHIPSPVAADASIVPVRVNLPELAAWLSQHTGGGDLDRLWAFVGRRWAEDGARWLPDVEPSVLVEDLRGQALLWIFDGLDEVPRTGNRAEVVRVIGAVSAEAGRQRRIVVTSRPPCSDEVLSRLEHMTFGALGVSEALDIGARLLAAWLPERASEHLALLRGEMAKRHVAALAATPLHATIATLLIAEEGVLPASRWQLFEHYFDTTLRRELKKPLAASSGLTRSDRELVLALHQRAGLILHTRAELTDSARPILTTAELRAQTLALVREHGYQEPEDRTRCESLMTFARERLVLLIRTEEDGYGFLIQPLREFFAAGELLHGDAEVVAARLSAIALAPHWANVIGLVVSHSALSPSSEQGRFLQLTVGVCERVEEEPLGHTASVGRRLAVRMLREL